MKHSLTTSTILKILRQNLLLSFALLFVIAAVVLFSLIPPQLLKIIIDQNLVLKTNQGLLRLALLYLAVLILIGFFDFLKGGLLTVFGQKIVKDLRIEMTLKLERISTTYFSANQPGSITSRFSNDVENVNSLFADGVISMMIDCFKIIGIVVSIWYFSLKLGILALCLVPLIYFVTRAFQQRMLAAQIKNLEQIGRVNSHISESLKNVRMIKSFSKEAYMEELYRGRLEDNFRTLERVNFYDSCYSPIIQVMRALIIALIVLLSTDQVQFLGISVGMVAASIELFTNLFAPIETLGSELQNVQKGISGVERINRFVLEPEEPAKDASLTADLILPGIRTAGMRFEHVSFAYAADQPVLQDLNLTIPYGANVTFTGRTGVGKTTLFRLIMGLLQPTGGKIELGGADVYRIPNSEKRRIFGYVEQQFSFIQGTVAEQISLADETIRAEQVEKALRFVGLHDYVMKMAKGYATVVDAGGGDFSQGQKQLLSIARAIVADPVILLLDEVTANLDSATEAKIVTVLQKAEEGRMVLSISHRITSMLHSDLIVLLEDGRILTTGAPDEVMNGSNWLAKQLRLEKNQWKDQ
ncbi:MAG: ABC transporter ATP-binding protein/permease [Negativicutes bacterium]|nr:ABC transporter ATP-binding protein/permease [Negativicutes bacterium]